MNTVRSVVVHAGNKPPHNSQVVTLTKQRLYTLHHIYICVDQILSKDGHAGCKPKYETIHYNQDKWIWFVSLIHLSIAIHTMEKWIFPSQLILPNLSIEVAHTFNHDETIEILCREGMTSLVDYLGTTFGILPSRITQPTRHMAIRRKNLSVLQH